MNKLFNWTFGSFFRTLGRFLFYLLIGFLISQLINISDIKLPNLFSILNVYAYETWPDSQNINITVNGSNLTTTSKLYRASGTHTFRIYSDQLYIPAYSDENVFKYNYGYISTCVSSSFTVGAYSSGYFSKNMRVYMTSVPCQIYNTTAYPNSVVMYITYELNQGPSSGTRTMCTTGSSSTLCTLDNSFDISVPKNVEYTLNSYGFSLEPFIFDDTTSSLINQNQVIINQNNQIINKIDSQTQQQHQDAQDIKNAMTDDSAPNLSGLNNSAGWLPAGPVDSILNLPLSFLTNLSNNLSKSCSPVVLPLPFVNQNLELPCLNSIYNQINGLPAWLNTIGTIASAFILFGYLINLYKYIDDTLTFRENNYIDNWSGV